LEHLFCYSIKMVALGSTPPFFRAEVGGVDVV
jgi:hypothetical protein